MPAYVYLLVWVSFIILFVSLPSFHFIIISEILSIGKTKINYPSPSKYVLSFKKNEEVRVYSKPAGKEQDLWGVEINGKRGYAPHMFIREEQILHKPKVKVPTELYELVNNEIVHKKIYERKVKNGAEDKQNAVNSDGQIAKTTEKLSSAGTSEKSSIINGALKESSDPDKNSIKASQTYTVDEGTTLYSGTEPEPPAVYENIKNEPLNTDSEVNEDSTDEQDGEGSGSGEEEYSGDEPTDGEDDLVDVDSRIGVGPDTGVQETVHSIMPLSSNVPATDEPKTDVNSNPANLPVDASVNDGIVLNGVLDSLPIDAPVNDTISVKSDLGNLTIDAPVKDAIVVKSDLGKLTIDEPIKGVIVNSVTENQPIEPPVNDAIVNSVSENLPIDEPVNETFVITSDLGSLLTETIQSSAHLKENIVDPETNDDMLAENTKDPVVPEVGLIQSNPVQIKIANDEPQLPTLEQNNIDQSVSKDIIKNSSPKDIVRNIDLPENVSPSNNINSEDSKKSEIVKRLSLQNKELPIKNNLNHLPDEAISNQTADNIKNTKHNLQTSEEIVKTVPYSEGPPTNNQDTKNTDTLIPVKTDINIKSIYLTPQSSSSHSLDSNSHIKEHHVEPFVHNGTESEMDNLNNTNILEGDGYNQDEQQGDVYQSTQIPPIRVTTDSNSEQYEAPILPGYYPSEASTQSLPPVESVTQYSVIPPTDLPEPVIEFSKDQISEPPPQPNPGGENLSYFEGYFSNVDKVKQSSEELVDPPQEAKENNSELKDDLLTQSETKAIDEVNNKNILINKDSVESLSLDAPLVSESYFSNLIGIFEGLSGKIFSLYQSTSRHSDDPASRLEEDGKPRFSNEAPALSSDSVASIFTGL